MRSSACDGRNGYYGCNVLYGPYVTAVMAAMALKKQYLICTRILKSACTVMTYSLWAYGPIIGGSSSRWMMITIPLVILGIFRYQMLSETNQNTKELKSNINILETPESVILSDKPLKIIVSICCFATYYLQVVSLPIVFIFFRYLLL